MVPEALSSNKSRHSGVGCSDHSHSHSHAHSSSCSHGHSHASTNDVKSDDKPDGPVEVPAELKVDLTDGEEGWKDPLGSGSLILNTMINPKDASKRPIPTQKVTLDLKGWLKGKKESVFMQEENLTCYIGDETLLPGVELALRMMGEGEVSLIRMVGRFGYQERGRGADLSPGGDVAVPANATLEFKVALRAVGDVMPEPGKMTPAQRIEFSSKKKALGNRRYKDRAFPPAIKAYKEALTFIGSASGWGGEEEKKALRKLKIDSENNLCAAHLASRDFGKARDAALRVFKIDEENLRCLERLAKIYLATNYLAKAESMIHRLKKLPEASSRVEVFEKTLEVTTALLPHRENSEGVPSR